MKAAILVENHKPLIIDMVSLPESLACGQVLVKIVYSGICGAQINEVEAAKGPDPFLPHLLGHEGSGIVMDTGPGVSTVKEGDHVVLHWRKSAGIESATPKYQWKGVNVNAGWVTTFNEYAIVSENRLTKIPSDFDMRIAPLFGCAVTTAFGVINNDAQVKIGQSVVVFGVGGVGLNIVQAAALVSAYPILAIDLFDHKLEMAENYGATHKVNSRLSTDLPSQIKAIVGEKGADVVIDTTGNARIIETAYELTHPDGRTILVGVPRKGDNVSLYTLPIHFNKILKGSHGGSCQPDVDIPRYVKLFTHHKLKLNDQITHEFPLERINEAIGLMKAGEAGRIVLKME